LDGVLSGLYAGRQEPIVVIVHLACPRISYTDRGKGSLVLTGEITEKAEEAPPPEPTPLPDATPPPEPAKPLAADEDGIIRIERRGERLPNNIMELVTKVLSK
jgi:hypothetical protein